MKIGTDISLKTCYDEGYTTIEFKVRELFPNGRKNGLDKECNVDIKRSYPDYIREELATEENPFGVGYILNESYSFSDLLGVYLDHKKSIDDCHGMEINSAMLENPDEYTLLTLADMVQEYIQT